MRVLQGETGFSATRLGVARILEVDAPGAFKGDGSRTDSDVGGTPEAPEKMEKAVGIALLSGSPVDPKGIPFMAGIQPGIIGENRKEAVHCPI
jgi:hypothetical protein